MSFKIIEQAKPRLNRSELAVPGSNPSLFEKAAKSNVDVIFLDLEDAVAPDEKEQARNTEQWDRVKELNKKIATQVKKDKLDYRLEQLEEMDEYGHSWTEIKRMKAKYTPKFCKFKDKEGNKRGRPTASPSIIRVITHVPPTAI